MKTTTDHSTTRCFLLFVLLICADTAFGEVSNRPTEGLFQGSTDVVVGELCATYSHDVDVANYYRYSHFVAEIRVQKVEKRSHFQVGTMAYVRYWRKKWLGEGHAPPGSAGHRGVPEIGSIVRAYVTNDKKLPRRPGKENDEGFDVILPNGLQLANEPSTQPPIPRGLN